MYIARQLLGSSTSAAAGSASELKLDAAAEDANAAFKCESDHQMGAKGETMTDESSTTEATEVSDLDSSLNSAVAGEGGGMDDEIWAEEESTAALSADASAELADALGSIAVTDATETNEAAIVIRGPQQKDVNRPKIASKVSFSTIEVREYPRIGLIHPETVGDHLISIDWEYLAQDHVCVDEYEASRPERRTKEGLLLPRAKRSLMLEMAKRARKRHEQAGWSTKKKMKHHVRRSLVGIGSALGAGPGTVKHSSGLGVKAN